MRAAPATERDLLDRARQLSGLTLGELAQRLGRAVPADPRRSKGLAGEMLEAALGATAGSAPEPDFPDLGVELKTIPVDRSGRPTESTWVCVAPLTVEPGMTWENSLVRRKLARVLWVPVAGDKAIPLGNRRIGSAVFWSPDPAQAGQLRTDWEEIMEYVALGRIGAITARHGTVLQVRPKAATGRARVRGTDDQGGSSATLPRGFYLRARFTAAILRAAYA